MEANLKVPTVLEFLNLKTIRRCCRRALTQDYQLKVLRISVQDWIKKTNYGVLIHNSRWSRQGHRKLLAMHKN